MLTASYTWMKGYAYDFLAILHAITVIFTLLWLPFGKFFHIFQRPAQLGVSFYKDVGARGPSRRAAAAAASRSRSALHVGDLIAVERELGFRYETRRRRRRALPVDLPALPPRAVRPGPGRLWGTAGRARPRRCRTIGRDDDHGHAPRRRPARSSTHFGPHLSADPARTRLEHRRRARPAGEDALLLLRPAVRHPAQGQGQRGHRLRAVGGLPVQPRHALPQGRQALPAGLAPRPAAHGAARAIRRRRRASARCPTTRPSRASPRRSSASRATHGPDAFGVLSGASLTTEKTYLMGKFARVCLKTPYIDYNGRLCMVSAGAGEQEGVRHRPHDQPLGGHPRRRGRSGSPARTSPSARRSPPTTSGRRASTGRRSSSRTRASRRSPAPATCSCRSSPGRDAALFTGVLHLMIENDWIDHDFIDAAHRRLRAGRRARASEWTPARTAEVTGVPERSIRQAAELWGTAKTSFLFHARGIEHHSNGVQNVLGTINLVLASGRIGKPKLRLRHDRRPGQRPGRPRARPEVRPAPRLARHREPRAPRVHRRRLGRRRATRSPARASTPTRSSARSTRGEIKGLLAHLLQPEGLAARQRLRHARAGEARVLRRHRLLPERHRPPRRRRAARLAAGGGRGHRHAGRGPGHQDQQGRRLPRRGAAGLADHPGHRRGARPRRTASPSTARARSSRSCASPRKGGVADYSGHHLREDRAADGRLLALLRDDPRPASRSTTRARRGCSSRAAGTRSPRAPGRSTSPTARRASTSPTTARPPRTSTPSTR